MEVIRGRERSRRQEIRYSIDSDERVQLETLIRTGKRPANC